MVLLVKYSGPFLKWTNEELRQMDQRTRKLMTIHIREMTFDHIIKWYKHKPKSTQENEIHKILKDFDIQTDHLILGRRLDDVSINKKKKPRIF